MNSFGVRTRTCLTVKEKCRDMVVVKQSQSPKVTSAKYDRVQVGKSTQKYLVLIKTIQGKGGEFW